MLTIIFAKTALLDPVRLSGPLSHRDMTIKEVKNYGRIQSDIIFAALLESPDGKLPVKLSESFDIFKVHHPHLRQSTYLPSTSLNNDKRSIRKRVRHQKREKKCTFSESSWTRFVKRKHLVNAYKEHTRKPPDMSFN